MSVDPSATALIEQFGVVVRKPTAFMHLLDNYATPKSAGKKT